MIVLVIYIVLNPSLMAYKEVDKEKALEKLVQEYFQDEAISSIVLHVEKNKKVIFSKIVTENKNVGETFFRTASIGKLFTATTILKLSEKNKLKLDDLIYNYLSDDILNKLNYKGKNYGRSITIEDLLSHRGGLFNTDNDISFQNWLSDNSERRKTPKELIEFATRDGISYPPKEKQVYASPGYFILGLIIENVTKKPYYQVVREEILEPLKMKNTYEETNESPKNINILKNYSGKYDMSQIDPSFEFADGGFITTPSDLSKFGHAFLNGAIFKEKKTYKNMINIRGKENIGLGVFIEKYDNFSYHLYHPGHWGSILYMIPKEDLVIVFSLNQTEADSEEFLNEILNILL